MTQREFAKKLSVSQATVSMALKDSPAISEELKNRIKQMAKEVGYSPNIAGQLLRRGKNNLIGCIFPSVHSSYYSELLIELFRCAQERGYLVILENIDDDNNVKSAISNLKRYHISGIIAESCSGATRYFDPEIPTVFLDRHISAPTEQGCFSYVYPDMYQAGKEIMEYLIKTGKKSITFLGQYGSDEERFHGVSDICSKHPGIKFNFVSYNGFNEEDGYALTDQLLKEYPETEIILAHNDAMAIGVIRRLWELRISVPEQICVAGFDNNNFGKFSTPQLTTIGPDLRELAEKAIQTVTDSIFNCEHKCILPIKCKLEKRESC